MTSHTALSVIFISLLLAASGSYRQQEAQFAKVKRAGDPRCDDTFGIDSCYITLHEGTVNDVIDGHTLTVAMQPLGDKSSKPSVMKLVLASVAAPDLKTPLGKEAKANLLKLALRKKISIEFFCNAKTGTITCSGMDLGLEQIKAGFARYDGSKSDAREITRCNYRYAEESAKARQLGVWQPKQ